MSKSFSKRHIGTSKKKEFKYLLKKTGVNKISELIEETIPSRIIVNDDLNIDKGISEHNYLIHIDEISKKNKLFKNYIGLGYNPSITPSVISRNIFENPSWYTAYTPYQPEISQGRLEALFNFQTVITELTGMEISNASLLDESTAAAEAMSLIYNLRSKEKESFNKFFVSKNTFPQTVSVLKTRAKPLGIKIVIGDEIETDFDNSFFGAFFQYPCNNGEIPNLPLLIERASSNGVKTIVAADLLSLVLLNGPGNYGADVVVGTSQRFGIPLGYGGPHAAFFATKLEYRRFIPGRIIGKSKDSNGNDALRMALQTREQHIKRDRATSNICTAQVLLAVMAGMYAVYHGPKGLIKIAKKINDYANKLNSIFQELGIIQINKNYFDTLCIKISSEKLKKIAEKSMINFNYIDSGMVSISLNECLSKRDFKKIVQTFEKYTGKKTNYLHVNDKISLCKNQIRKNKFLQHITFNSYHSETSIMRYIKFLEKKDISLTDSMIPLGSCTMKLNAASEMIPLSSKYWTDIHPFAPLNQTKGYQSVLSSLEKKLSVITGFHSTSLQPNSGAQGEYAGLLVIKAYHESNGNYNRNICLIPSSAHGTNPASAVMAGMKVIVVKTDDLGNIDWNDLKDKVCKFKDNLSALMITYPSTHGVFEANIKQITKLVHDNGGQVYMDGANMNAQVGITNPKMIGADVCHLNLHKTFSIPHGGGGPGVGPICVAKHLSKFLPSNPIIKTGGEKAISAVSSAPWGSAMACIISYGYIKMLGRNGLKKSTQHAILNANYIKSRLEGAFKILYVGEKNRTAHELIIDLRIFKKKNIDAVDIAKRLIDYGFHSPTLSFPVAGTMMIEPTESENLEEIDKFCDSLISIRMEIESLNYHDEKSVLKNSPHTLDEVCSDNWSHSYSRQKAAFPLDFVKKNKFWPSVSRIDEGFGDRNLICSCLPTKKYVNV